MGGTYLHKWASNLQNVRIRPTQFFDPTCTKCVLSTNWKLRIRPKLDTHFSLNISVFWTRVDRTNRTSSATVQKHVYVWHSYIYAFLSLEYVWQTHLFTDKHIYLLTNTSIYSKMIAILKHFIYQNVRFKFLT